MQPEEDWPGRAACRGFPNPEWFFDMSPSPVVILNELQSLCRGCRVFSACRAYIDSMEEGVAPARCHGFWAGETVKERIIRRKEFPDG